MKRRLYHPPLAEVKLAFARQKTVAEQVLCTLQRTALYEFMGVDDKEIANEIRMIQKISRLRTHPEITNVTEM
jgi:hypothetical protein